MRRQGQLFTQDFLLRGIRDTPAYQALDEAALVRFRDTLSAICAPTNQGCLKAAYRANSR